MTLSEQTIHRFLQDNILSNNKLESFSLNLKDLSSVDLAAFYTTSAFLVSAMEYIKEQYWLENQNSPKSYVDFLLPLFKNDLRVISFCSVFLCSHSEKDIRKISRMCAYLEAMSLKEVLKNDFSYKKEFVINALTTMREYFLNEEALQNALEQNLGHQGVRLYRTFDNLDLIFDLDYELDANMIVDHVTKERLYQRSGVGVQSGYSTILLALDALALPNGASVTDLGSGYGRVGLVFSLMRPDLFITGYEYVEHRVKVANVATKNLKLCNGLEFFTQDLSDRSFELPRSDVYYLYDSFTDETHRYVLDLLVEMSKSKAITVVTKGNASRWLNEIVESYSWPAPRLIDYGNLCIYKS